MTHSRDDSQKRNQRTLTMLRRAIAFSDGEFSLILVRCNYQLLRDRLLEKLGEFEDYEIRTISLMPKTQTLYKTISEGLGATKPNALMVFGLELLDDIEALVTATNQVRDEFRKHFPFVLVLWVNDPVLKSLIQKAPDFHSWATTSEVVLSNDELIGLLQEVTDPVFSAALEDGSMRLRSNTQLLGDRYRLELDAALTDLQKRGVQVSPRLNTRVEFVLGRDDYWSDRLDEALVHYQNSIDSCWQGIEDPENGKKPAPVVPMLPIVGNRSAIWPNRKPSPNWVDLGLVLFYRGLCFCRKADIEQTKREEYLIQARRELEKCKESFEESGRRDLQAKFLGQLGVVFQRLSDWPALEQQAKQLLKLDREYGNAYLLAQDYGFLAEVALQKRQWQKAQKWATQALEIIDEDGMFSRVRGLYVLLLARSQAHLGQFAEAIANLDCNLNIARRDPDYDPQIYLNSLKELRSLYFQQEDYPRAFRLKQERRAIEAQLGLRAFIGAGRLHSQRHSLNPTISQTSVHTTVAEEIKFSGRQQDVNDLISRLGRNDYKLTVIHGPSGVGKSSLVQAGLVPQLRQKVIGARTPLPLLVQLYTDWLTALEASLQRELECLDDSRGSASVPAPVQGTRGAEVQGSRGAEVQGTSRGSASVPAPSSRGSASVPAPELLSDEPATFEQKRAKILKILGENANRNLLTVLIFDQFEEFFFVRTDLADKKQFYEFLRDCLNLPFVKVIMSLREDYLHYLLECDRLYPIDTLNRDILNKTIRYYIGNFSKDSAYNVINSLTERSEIQLTPELLDRLVDDLANEIGKVRPIELQVVGAQLQAQNIRTLAEYEEHGPKEKLVERFLEEVIDDCGPNNERAARLLLYFLTEETGIRPLKTLPKLASELLQAGLKVKQLESILDILEKSGLLFKLPEIPANRYQLVHDYLVTFIRQQPQIQQELQALQKKYQQLVKEKELADKLAAAKDKEKQTLQFTRNLTAAGLLIFIGLSGIAWHQTQVTKKAEQKATMAAEKAEIAAQGANDARQRAEIAEIEATNAATKALLLSNNQLEALVASVKAGIKVQNINPLPPRIEAETINRLYTTVHKISEMNRLQGHRDSVVSVSFLANGDFLVSGSIDNTVKIWDSNGQILQTIFAHDRPITRVAVSPDGQLIASASIDKTVKLWQPDGTKVAHLAGHTEGVTGVSFSPNSDLIATSSQDKTIKLWKPDGTLLKTFNGHDEAVTSVSFSPLQTDTPPVLKKGEARGHDEAVTIVSFSPLQKDTPPVPLKKEEARGGDRLSLALLKKDPPPVPLKKGEARGGDRLSLALLKTDPPPVPLKKDPPPVPLKKDPPPVPLKKGEARGGDRLSIAPLFKGGWGDRPIIASTSADNTIKLWNYEGKLLKTLKGHADAVTGLSFSPDGKRIASASWDRTVKLWNADGTLFKTLTGHGDRVLGVTFSPDGKIMASAGADNTVILWNSDGTKIRQLRGHQQPVRGVSFSPDGKILASASSDNTIKLWKTFVSGDLPAIKQHDKPVLAVAYSPDGQILATASEDTTVRLWSPKGLEIKELTGHKKAVWDVSFSPNGKMLASASGDKTVRLWKIAGKPVNKIIGQHSARVLAVSFSPSGKTIASGSEDGVMQWWDLNGKNLIKIKAHDEEINRISYSPKGDRLATASSDNTVKIWEADGTLHTTLYGHQGDVWSVSYSPTGDRLATASNDNTVKIWDADGNLIKTLTGHLGSVYWVSFSRDGEFIATASKDKTVKLWDGNGNLLTTLEGHTAAVLSLSFNEDGNVVASASQDKKVILWNLELDKLVLEGCNWIEDYLATNPLMQRDRDLCNNE